MGSMISLGVENLEIDWGKNSTFRNHSCLFVPSDKTVAPYHYVSNNDDGSLEAIHKPAYSRDLASVKRRLHLLGYTLDGCQRDYEESRSYFFRHEESDEHKLLTFDRFAAILAAVDVTQLEVPGPADDYNFGEYAARCILADPGFPSLGMDESTLRWSAGEFLDNMDPYVILRLLCENPDNLRRPVIWRHHDVVEEGYVDESEIFHGVGQQDKILIVTEGSSDTSVLKASLQSRFTEVSDFFTFIDMKENYPFTGTGNLLRFVQGLTAIQYSRRTLVVLDNDTAGNAVASQLNDLRLPANFIVCVLPDLEECREFRTVGPSGEVNADVNGTASSIEMFLDLRFRYSQRPLVRWTSFDRKRKAYQGELEEKENFTQLFLSAGVHSPEYDWSKLSRLWEYLLSRCEQIQ